MAKKAKRSKAPKTKAPKATRKAAPKAPQKKTVGDKIRKVASTLTGAASKAVKNFAASLGSMKIDKAQAPEQMEELGTLLEDVATAKATADAKADDAKTAKGTYESKVNLLLEKLRGFTHPKALPLFDQAASEADLLAMTAENGVFGGSEAEPVNEEPF